MDILGLNRGNFIAGQWEAGSGSTFPMVAPATGKPIGDLVFADAETVSRAVGSATVAFSAWAELGGAARGEYLDRMSMGLLARRDALVDLICLTNGKPRSEAQADVTDAARTLAYYADQARALDRRQGQAVDYQADGFGSSTYFEAVGPVAAILPWNFPLKIASWKLGPALAAGCSVVLKPSPQSPLAENVWAEVAHEAGLPSGVLNIVHGDGSVVGPALVEDPRIAKISFTGSTLIGQGLMRAAAQDVKRIGLELGGKSPIIVFADADLDLATRLAMEGVFYNAGQCCNATGRLLVEASIAEQLITRLAERVAGLTLGAPATDADIGPVISSAQHSRIMGFLNVAEGEEGLVPVIGGRAGDRPQSGFFVPPTIYRDVPWNSRLWNEEIFGPVLAIATFDTEEEAVARANDTEYGLAASIVTGDAGRGRRVARRIQAGHVYLNTSVAIPPQTMWGGFKKSGLGRELGPWGLAGYLEPKTLTAAEAL